MPTTASHLVTAARQQIVEIPPTALPALGEGPVLIDVREPAEYATGHLAGAVNIPRGVLEFEIEAHPAVGCATDPALADRQRPIVVYCRTGGRSALAALSLQQLGFTDVRSVAGGIMGCTAAGLAVVTR